MAFDELEVVALAGGVDPDIIADIQDQLIRKGQTGVEFLDFLVRAFRRNPPCIPSPSRACVCVHARERQRERRRSDACLRVVCFCVDFEDNATLLCYDGNKNHSRA